MLFSKGGCTQGFNTFLTAMNLPREPVSGLLVLNPIGTNKHHIDSAAFIALKLPCRRAGSWVCTRPSDQNQQGPSYAGLSGPIGRFSVKFPLIFSFF
jgi:hypothetical protein